LLASLGGKEVLLAWVANATVYGIIAIAVVRLGLLSLVAAIFAANASILTGALQGGWYTANSVFALALLIGLAVWGCWSAMAGAALWRSESLG